MKKSIIFCISGIISILLTGVIPSLFIELIPIDFRVFAIIICILFAIIFSLIYAIFYNKYSKSEKKESEKLRDEIKNLKIEKDTLEKQKQMLEKEKEKLISEKKTAIDRNLELESIVNKYVQNSYAATGIVFNKNYSKVLLAYHKRQKKWIPPGSHIDGVEFFHEIVIESARRETGYTIDFHESHNYEEYKDDNCFIVPCPFSVQVETQIANEGHEFHYDALYILTADEEEKVSTPGTHKVQWLTLKQLEDFAKRGNTYPDVIRSVNEALQIIYAQKGGDQNEV